MKKVDFNIYALPVFTECSFRYFNRGEKHITRTYDNYVLIFMLKRKLYFSEDGISSEVSEGEWYLQIPGLKQEGVRECPSPEYFYIHFLADSVTNPDNSDISSTFSVPIRGTFDKDYFLSWFTQLDELYRKFPWDILGQQAAFLNVINHISSKNPGRMIKRNRFIYDILDYLHKEYNKPLSMELLSDKFNYSKDYIARKLKQETGYTPHGYIQAIRLQSAKELLSNTDYSIDSISRQTGYGDTSIFYKAFRANTGKTPGQWRKESRQ